MQYYSSGRLSQHLLWLASLAGVVGLLASRALVALSPVVGVLAALANPQVRHLWPRYFRNGAAMRAAGMIVLLLLSGFYTSEWPVWRHEVFRSLTWLAVPLAFTLAVPLTGRQRWAVGVLFVAGTAAVGLATVGKYLLDPRAANEAIHIGHNVQAITRVFHIYFGVMLALAFFWGLLLRRSPWAERVAQRGLLVAALVAAGALHVLAYRTGLLVFYAALLAYVGHSLVRRNFVLSLGLLVLLALGPWLAYNTLDSVRERTRATIYDVQQFQEGRDLNNFSLSRRLTAIEAATLVIRQHWLLGVGQADTHAALMAQYRQNDFGLRPANRVDVHNQYLETLLGGGLVGLALWLAVLFWPFTQAWARRDPYLCFFVLVQATLMLGADILSLQTGLNLFVFGYGFLVVAGEARQQAAATLTTNSTRPGA
ncbi:O-antigen ligase family protein [Hymenobacter bucti]|uniref:O-antigen ligase family protein n=1 Tax=Hymenobacter bucti TaxID=1844114 RepID=A0ABW4QW36_9BACT